MATLENIDYQKYVQLPDGMVIGIPVAPNSVNNITVVGAAGTQCTIVSFHQANTSSPGSRT
jgi:hypothetical protein